GTGMPGEVTVSFGTQPATIVVGETTASQIAVLVPSGVTGQSVDVTVNNLLNGAQQISPNAFTYGAASPDEAAAPTVVDCGGPPRIELPPGAVGAFTGSKFTVVLTNPPPDPPMLRFWDGSTLLATTNNYCGLSGGRSDWLVPQNINLPDPKVLQ